MRRAHFEIPRRSLLGRLALGAGACLLTPSSWVKGRPDAQTNMVRSDDANTHSWADMYCSLAHALGAPTESFGKAGEEPVKGPVSRMLV